ncbi:hypothetical protein B0J12DRAFT_687630 [Macrophomina phaseolina]|uniref:Uncharacterized protein n=1 Tax=Macrophomina phaseolina TaxID=35725 RepID=A0ABQ8FS68_9PEZI|nr:hypothetical protein B0J12DRAFT_687630 [Macrophomina phaseolina]
MLRDARRLFRWSEEQIYAARRLWWALQSQGEAAQVRRLLMFSASFIFQTVGDRPFDSGLVHFLAVLGIDQDMGRLQRAKDYSYMLAGLVYCARVLAAEALLPSAEREEQGDTERD